jgi:hypothetical protein
VVGGVVAVVVVLVGGVVVDCGFCGGCGVDSVPADFTGPGASTLVGVVVAGFCWSCEV